MLGVLGVWETAPGCLASLRGGSPGTGGRRVAASFWFRLLRAGAGYRLIDAYRLARLSCSRDPLSVNDDLQGKAESGEDMVRGLLEVPLLRIGLTGVDSPGRG